MKTERLYAFSRGVLGRQALSSPSLSLSLSLSLSPPLSLKEPRFSPSLSLVCTFLRLPFPTTTHFLVSFRRRRLLPTFRARRSNAMVPTPVQRDMETAANISLTLFAAVVTILLSGSLPIAISLDDNYGGGVNQFITSVIYGKLSNLTGTFAGDIGNQLGFCIKDR